MLELTGKNGIAKVFTDNIEETAIGQVVTMLNSDIAKNQQVRIMPDVHAGKGSTVGTTIRGDLEKISPNIVGVDIGCLDKDTEVLTLEGWLPINMYRGQQILVYDTDTDHSFFELPLAYIVKPEDYFYHFKNSKGLDQMVSNEHNMLVYQGHKSRGYKHTYMKPSEILSKSLEKGYYTFKASFNHLGNKLPISDADIRITAMISADGTIRRIDKKGLVHYELHFKKEHKIERAHKILSERGISYKHTFSDVTNTTYFYFNSKTYYDKDLTKFYGANAHQLAILAEESLKWDGHINNKDSLYYTTIKQNADVIQFALASNNYRAGLYLTETEKSHWSANYTVRKTKNNQVGYSRAVEKIPSTDGKKYCFTTSTGAFVARRNNNIFLTGNCGIMMWKLNIKAEDLDLKKIDEVARRVVPTGFNVHQKAQGEHRDFVDNLTFSIGKNRNRVLQSIGTLGGGNHYLEIAVDGDDGIWLSVHSGSRGLGVQVATHHQKIAERNIVGHAKEIEEVIETLKKEGREKDIQSEIARIKERHAMTNVELAYLTGDKLQDYLSDMTTAQSYAVLNRTTMLQNIVDAMDWEVIDKFDSMHNYVDIGNKIIRKGATSAQKGERLVIPLNMRDGSLICTGKGNSDWNYSAPHGAGRVMSRSQAKREIDFDVYEEQMKDVYSSSVVPSTLDEAPDAYKPPKEIIANIKDTVDVIHHLKPLWNMKDKLKENS